MTITNKRKNATPLTGKELDKLKKQEYTLQDIRVDNEGNTTKKFYTVSAVVFRQGTHYLVRTGKDIAQWMKLEKETAA